MQSDLEKRWGLRQEKGDSRLLFSVTVLGDQNLKVMQAVLLSVTYVLTARVTN